MSGRRWTAVAVAVVAAAVSVGIGGASPTSRTQPAVADSPPNVVVLMTDDQTVEQMRVLPEVQSRLGGAGVTFANAFVTYPLCCPSRTTFLTGQYTHNHGVRGNTGPDTESATPSPEVGGEGAEPEGEQEFRSDAERNSLAVSLSYGGYYTGLLGKYLNGYGSGIDGNSPATRVPPGWTDWRAAIAPSFDYWQTDLNVNGTVEDHTGEFQTDLYAAQAEDMIDQASASDRPFYLQIGFSAPHQSTGQGSIYADRHATEFADESAPRPASFNEVFMDDKPGFLRSYYHALSPMEEGAVDLGYRRELRSLLSVDEAVVRILDRLEATGELENTILLFTSDNGFYHGEHRIPDGKYFPYEPAIHVPLIIAGAAVPAEVQGTVSDAFVANIDFAPTILDLTGVAPRRLPDGRSLRPLLEGDDDLWSVGSDPSDPGPSRTRPLLLTGARGGSSRHPTLSYNGVRSADGWVYIRWRVGSRFRYELYDLATDPDQLLNRAGDPDVEDRQAQLERQRQLLARCAGLSCDVPPYGYLDLPATGDAPWFEAAQWADAQSLGAADEIGTFRPADATTRGEFLNWLWRHAGAPEGAPDAGLADVPDELTTAVAWAVDAGVVDVPADNRFRPFAPLTRFDGAAWLWRLAGEPDVSTTHLPPDVSPSSPDATAVAWLLQDPPGEDGPIAYVFSDGRFHGSDSLRRGRAIVVLRRFDLQLAS